jgi:hypothetical protein
LALPPSHNLLKPDAGGTDTRGIADIPRAGVGTIRLIGAIMDGVTARTGIMDIGIVE